MGITHLESLELIDLAGSGTQMVTVDNEGLLGIGGGIGPVPVPLVLGDGVNPLPFQPDPQLLSVGLGSLADPMVTIGPLAKFFQYSNIDARDWPGCTNPLSSACWAPVDVLTINKQTAYNMATAINAEAYGDTDNGGVGDGNADLLAGSFVARKGYFDGPGRGGAIGLYAEAGRYNIGGGPGNGVMAMEGRSSNFTAVDCRKDASEGSCYSFHASSESPTHLGGVAYNAFAFGRGFEVGLMLDSGAIADVGFSILDQSHGGTTLRIEGEHMWGIDTRAAVWQAGGRAIILGNDHSIAWNDDALSNPTIVLEGNAATDAFRVTRAGGNVHMSVVGDISVDSLKTTGLAGGKKVVCVDTATGTLYASSTGIDCTN